MQGQRLIEFKITTDTFFINHIMVEKTSQKYVCLFYETGSENSVPCPMLVKRTFVTRKSVNISQNLIKKPFLLQKNSFFFIFGQIKLFSNFFPFIFFLCTETCF